MSKDHFRSILRIMTQKPNGVKLPTTKILDIQSPLHLTITSYESYLKTSYIVVSLFRIGPNGLLLLIIL